jgi:hypothetical protein
MVMRGFWRTRLWKMIILLVFLAGMQPLAVPTMPVASMDMAQQASKAVAGDCARCDMSGKSAGFCHMICTPTSATNVGDLADMTMPASPSWPTYEMASFGRIVRPGLAPPRTS